MYLYMYMQQLDNEEHVLYNYMYMYMYIQFFINGVQQYMYMYIILLLLLFIFTNQVKHFLAISSIVNFQNGNKNCLNSICDYKHVHVHVCIGWYTGHMTVYWQCIPYQSAYTEYNLCIVLIDREYFREKGEDVVSEEISVYAGIIRKVSETSNQLWKREREKERERGRERERERKRERESEGERESVVREKVIECEGEKGRYSQQ